MTGPGTPGLVARIEPTWGGWWVLYVARVDTTGTTTAHLFGDDLPDAGNDPRDRADQRLARARFHRDNDDWTPHTDGNWYALLTQTERPTT